MLNEITTNDVTYMVSPNITATHAFTTRYGGDSSGIFESLNLAIRVGDKPENVQTNYSRLCAALGITTDDIVCSRQVHGTHIRIVSHKDRCELFLSDRGLNSKPHQADGLITQTPGIALLVYAADCVPILLHDPVRKVIGAVHAGWRGTASGIAGIAVQKMESEFGCLAVDIKAAIGPCISKCCFETDNDVADALLSSTHGSFEKCVSTKYAAAHGTKFLIDLKKANCIALKNAGVSDVTVSDECTSCLSDKYWSHRKTKGQRGSQAAIIVMR